MAAFYNPVAVKPSAKAPKVPGSVVGDPELGEATPSTEIPTEVKKPSSAVSIPVRETPQEEGNRVLARAMGFKPRGGKKSRKQKKRVHKKTQKRRARK